MESKSFEQFNAEYAHKQWIKEMSEPQPKSSPLASFFFYFTLLAIVLSVAVFAKPGSIVFGFSYRTILTESMKSEMPPGTFILIKTVDVATIEVGDDITFYKDENTVVTHRVVNILEDYEDSGLLAFETKGIDNRDKDDFITVELNVIGKVVWHVKYLGDVIQTTADYWFYVAGGILLVFSISYFMRILLKKEPENPGTPNS